MYQTHGSAGPRFVAPKAPANRFPSAVSGYRNRLRRTEGRACGGRGETAITVVTAAIGNAILDGTGLRLRDSFQAIVPVLRHPRCMNCHSIGDYPRQGDDSHPHTIDIRRGPDGKCVNADPNRNGHRTIQQVVEHMSTPLVLWGWRPGEGRTPIPMPLAQFEANVKAWAGQGAPCPTEQR